MSNQWQYPGQGPQGPGWPPQPAGQQPPQDQGYPRNPPPANQSYGWGYPGYPGYPGYAAATPSNGMATASLVLGIIFLVFFFLGLITLAGDILAIVFGALGTGRASRMGAPGKGRATAGIVLGSIALVIYVIFGALSLGIGWLL